eukprot:g27149.t1
MAQRVRRSKLHPKSTEESTSAPQTRHPALDGLLGRHRLRRSGVAGELKGGWLEVTCHSSSENLDNEWRSDRQRSGWAD